MKKCFTCSCQSPVFAPPSTPVPYSLIKPQQKYQPLPSSTLCTLPLKTSSLPMFWILFGPVCIWKKKKTEVIGQSKCSHFKSALMDKLNNCGKNEHGNWISPFCLVCFMLHPNYVKYVELQKDLLSITYNICDLDVMVLYSLLLT